MPDEPTETHAPDFANRPKGWMVELARRAMRGLTPEQRRRAYEFGQVHKDALDA